MVGDTPCSPVVRPGALLETSTAGAAFEMARARRARIRFLETSSLTALRASEPFTLSFSEMIDGVMSFCLGTSDSCDTHVVQSRASLMSASVWRARHGVAVARSARVRAPSSRRSSCRRGRGWRASPSPCPCSTSAAHEWAHSGVGVCRRLRAASGEEERSGGCASASRPRRAAAGTGRVIVVVRRRPRSSSRL
jgi:hypothetical protein